MSRMAARQSLISTWRWALETVGAFIASRPALVRRLVVNAFVLMAGVLLMLARTSPALAADNSHGQGKAQDRTSASAVTQRHDSPSHSSDQQIGGGDGNDNAKAAARAAAERTARGARGGGESESQGSRSGCSGGPSQGSRTGSGRSPGQGSSSGCGGSPGQGSAERQRKVIGSACCASKRQLRPALAGRRYGQGERQLRHHREGGRQLGQPRQGRHHR